MLVPKLEDRISADECVASLRMMNARFGKDPHYGEPMGRDMDPLQLPYPALVNQDSQEYIKKVWIV